MNSRNRNKYFFSRNRTPGIGSDFHITRNRTSEVVPKAKITRNWTGIGIPIRSLSQTQDACIRNKDMGILKLPDVYKLKVNICMYKMLKLNECASIRRNLRLEHATHSYDTRTADNLVLPFPRVETIRINFQYQFINIWNSTPSAIKELPNFRSFKKTLIDFYLNSY